MVGPGQSQPSHSSIFSSDNNEDQSGLAYETLLTRPRAIYSNNGLFSSPSTIIIYRHNDFHPSDLFTIFSQTKLSFSPNTAFYNNVRVIDGQLQLA